MTIPTLLLRYMTQDVTCAVEVIEQNQYCLPKRFEESDTIVDIGAQVGTFAYACLTRGCGRVLCYEPELENFKLLNRNMAGWNGKAIAHHRAVWRDNGKVQVQPAPELYTAMHRTLGYDANGDGQVVEAVSLGSILERAGPIRLLKIDCEGAEKPILDSVGPRGMENVQELAGEIHYHCPEKGGEPATDGWLRSRLVSLGFVAHLIDTVKESTGPADPKMINMFWAWRRVEDAHAAMAYHQ